MSNKGISVIICTYNGAQQLEKTVAHLLVQQNLEDTNWEIIIVNNNSNDNTEEVIKSIIRTNTAFNIYAYYQAIPGKLAAIEMAVNEANFNYLLICDDDNWLNNNYLSTAYHFMEDEPSVGVLGGKGLPVNKDELPQWIIPHLHNFAAAEQWSKSADITYSMGSVYGAGMVIRKEIYNYVFKHNWPLNLSSKRKGKNLISGEDTEICYIARLLGYKIFYLETLEFKHNFPLAKISKAYLLKLVYFFGYGAGVLMPYTEKDTQRKDSLIKIFIIELYRLLRYNLISNIINNDLEGKKRLQHRLGFLKSIVENRKKIKSLRAFLEQKNANASTSHYI